MEGVRSSAGRHFDIAISLYNKANFKLAKEGLLKALSAAAKSDPENLTGKIKYYLVMCNKNGG